MSTEIYSGMLNGFNGSVKSCGSSSGSGSASGSGVSASEGSFRGLFASLMGQMTADSGKHFAALQRKAAMLGQENAPDGLQTGSMVADHRESSLETSGLGSALIQSGAKGLPLNLADASGKSGPDGISESGKEAKKGNDADEQEAMFDLSAYGLQGSLLQGPAEKNSEKTSADTVRPFRTAFESMQGLSRNHPAGQNAAEEPQRADAMTEPISGKAGQPGETMEFSGMMEDKQTQTGFSESASALREAAVDSSHDPKMITQTEKEKIALSSSNPVLNEQADRQENEHFKRAAESTHGELQTQGASVTESVHTAAQPQSSGKTEAYSQVSQEILSKLEQKGPMEFRLQLEPEELGQIEIKLKLKDGSLMIDIASASAKTHDLLTGQVDKLIASIGLQNVRVEQVQISQQTDHQNQNQFSQSLNSSQQGFSMNSGMDMSQRGYQEQFRGQMRGSDDVSLLRDDTAAFAEDASEGISPIRMDTRRMDYAV